MMKRAMVYSWVSGVNDKRRSDQCGPTVTVECQCEVHCTLYSLFEKRLILIYKESQKSGALLKTLSIVTASRDLLFYTTEIND